MKPPKARRPWLDTSFEIEGSWWPNFADEKGRSREKLKRHGKLTYSPHDGAILKLHHEGPDLGWGTNLIFGGQGDHGFDPKISCLGTHSVSGDSNSTTFEIDHVFKGFHLPPVKDAKFLELSFGIKNLNNWAHSTGYKFKRHKGNRGFQVAYREAKGKWVSLNKEISVRIERPTSSHLIRAHGASAGTGGCAFLPGTTDRLPVVT